MNYKQCDIVLIPFPYSDLSSFRQRPALIISNSILNSTQDVICCLVTRNSDYNCLLMPEDCFADGKLPFKSWIKPYRIFTVHKNIIKKKICSVKGKFYDKLLIEIQKYISRD
ncbi:type II toxin-antitoxin system PemK/MazF family toxin [Candidatus Pacearchaeota archaeon]|nr:type II toxin-antitoxin system PemK/MazF family toxin [Candidatus Pacearchaeota archaeon]